MQKPRVLFVSHGGGPMPLLGDPSHADMVWSLIHIPHISNADPQEI